MQEEYTNDECLRKEHIKDARKTCSRIGLSLAMFLLVTTVSQLGISALAAKGIIPLANDEIDKSMILSMGAMYLIGFPVFLLMSRQISVTEKIPVRKWSFGELTVAFIICLGFVYIGNIIGNVLMFLVSVISGKPMVNDLDLVLGNMNVWLVLLLTVLCAPIIEETMFRKVLVDRLIPYGEGVAVVVSGVTFGLVHGNFYQFFYACALGMIFAYVYAKTGKLRYSIIFHMLINFIGGVVPMGMLKLMESHFWLGTLVSGTVGFFIIGFIISGIVLLICFRGQITFRSGTMEIPKGFRFSTIFLNVGMILYVAFCVGLFIMG